jgi:hypothetical protein
VLVETAIVHEFERQAEDHAKAKDGDGEGANLPPFLFALQINTPQTTSSPFTEPRPSSQGASI